MCRPQTVQCMSHVNICHIFSTNVLFGKHLYTGTMKERNTQPSDCHGISMTLMIAVSCVIYWQSSHFVQVHCSHDMASGHKNKSLSNISVVKMRLWDQQAPSFHVHVCTNKFSHNQMSDYYLKSLMTELRSSWMECCSILLREHRELQRENIRGVSSAYRSAPPNVTTLPEVMNTAFKSSFLADIPSVTDMQHTTYLYYITDRTDPYCH